MKKALMELLASKKFLVALLSVVVFGLGKAGLSLTVEQLLPVLAPLWGYIFGQGLADLGKEKAKVLVESAGKPDGSE